jgi:orotate phosphoribosyltransferase
MNRSEEALARLLVRHSVFYQPRKPFILASGKKSAFYFDCRRTTLLHEAMPLIGRLIYARIRDSAEAVGGLTMGADPIACAVAYYSAKRKNPIVAFSVRKEPKSHGREQWVEGPLRSRARVAVVEDVVTTGGSTLRAIERCRQEGLRVVAVITLVDREEGGLDRIASEVGADCVHAIFRRSEIDEIWRQERRRRHR